MTALVAQYEPLAQVLNDGPDISFDSLDGNAIKCLERYPDSVKTVDSLDLSVLHVLLMNEKMTLEMVDVLLKVHPDAFNDVGPLGMYPLHLACNNPHAPLELLKLLSSYYTKDGRAVLTVADENNHLPGALVI